MNRRPWLFAAGAVALLALGVELASRVGGEQAERRVRRNFAVTGALDTVSLRAAVLREIPIGSPESRLAWFADSAQLGVDWASIYDAADLQAKAWLRFDETPPPLDLVMESWIIAFDYDHAHRLRDVHVRHALTGP